MNPCVESWVLAHHMKGTFHTTPACRLSLLFIPCANSQRKSAIVSLSIPAIGGNLNTLKQNWEENSSFLLNTRQKKMPIISSDFQPFFLSHNTRKGAEIVKAHHQFLENGQEVSHCWQGLTPNPCANLCIICSTPVVAHWLKITVQQTCNITKKFPNSWNFRQKVAKSCQFPAITTRRRKQHNNIFTQV